jgi:hypothetical protein
MYKVVWEMQTPVRKKPCKLCKVFYLYETRISFAWQGSYSLLKPVKKWKNEFWIAPDPI